MKPIKLSTVLHDLRLIAAGRDGMSLPENLLMAAVIIGVLLPTQLIENRWVIGGLIFLASLLIWWWDSRPPRF